MDCGCCYESESEDESGSVQIKEVNGKGLESLLGS